VTDSDDRDSLLEKLSQSKRRESRLRERVKGMAIEAAALKAAGGEEGLLSSLAKTYLRAEVDDQGSVQVYVPGEDGKPRLIIPPGTAEVRQMNAADLTDELCKKHPYLKKPSSANTPASSRPNPWRKETFNLTEQMKMIRNDPSTAGRLRAEAGVVD
jgi:hypothetical protein